MTFSDNVVPGRTARPVRLPAPAGGARHARRPPPQGDPGGWVGSSTGDATIRIFIQTSISPFATFFVGLTAAPQHCPWKENEP